MMAHPMSRILAILWLTYLTFQENIIKTDAHLCPAKLNKRFVHDGVKNENELSSILLDYSTIQNQSVGIRIKNSELLMLEIDQKAHFNRLPKVSELVLEDTSVYILCPPQVENPFDGSKIQKLKFIRFKGLHALNFTMVSFPDLEYLEVVHSPVVYLRKEFGNLGKLGIIIMSHASVVWLETGAFKNQDQLNYLDLEGNDISEMTRAELPENATNLWYLNLSHNKLKRIDKLGLESLTSLKELYLNDNQLTALNSNEVHVHSLRELWLAGNYDLQCEDLCWLKKVRKGSRSWTIGLASVLCRLSDQNTEIFLDYVCK